MKCTYSCHSPEHTMARRKFLAGMAATAAGSMVGGLGVFSQPARGRAAQEGPEADRRLQHARRLEPARELGPQAGHGDRRPVPRDQHVGSRNPGLRVAAERRQADAPPLPGARGEHQRGRPRQGRLPDDHRAQADARRRITRTSGPSAPRPWPPTRAALPGHIVITPGGGGGRGNDSAYLGPKYASIHLGNGNAPRYTTRPGQVTEPMDAARHDFRRRVNDRFLNRRRTAVTEAYTYSYEQAIQLMGQREVFDVTKEPAKDHERYGKYDLGRHCLLARRLLEKGATFVQVSHSNYDTHNENFNFHIEQLGEFDRSFAVFVEDLAARGMLESTLIVVLSEFGRTPNINLYYGRDHWSHAWTVVMAGARVHRGRRLRQDECEGDGSRRRPGRSRQPLPHLPPGRGRRVRPTRSTSKAATSRWPTRPRR